MVLEKSLTANHKAIGILQPGYLPWLGFFDQLHNVDVFVIYDDVQYDKGGWRNRNRIKTPAGAQWLTVPVQIKGAGKPLVKDVRINTLSAWQEKHIKTLRQNYSRAPFFDKYAGTLFRIIDKPWKFLVDLDVELIIWLSRELGITTPIRFSSELAISGDRLTRLIEIVKTLGGDCFYEGASGRNYIDEMLFSTEGINIIFQEFKAATYQQLHGPFIPNLSVVDLLFNVGPASLEIINSSQQEKE